MTDYKQKLQDLLYELFQFDSADLDFGFYAVMNQKRAQIAHFIQVELLDAITQGLKDIATQSHVEAQAAFDEARQELVAMLGEDALDGDELQDAFKKTPLAKSYLAAKAMLEAAIVVQQTEVAIYNDLYAFFARYYQDGDFISQRRYGSSDKYAIPYNGQEVHLHWANFDQYYVKTGVHFYTYSFTVPPAIGLENETKVHIRITQVDTPRDNVKGDKRYFIYAADQAVSWQPANATLSIPLEYRPLTLEESADLGARNQQEQLLERAHTAILQAIPNAALRVRLEERDPQKKSELGRLAYHLKRYAAENTRDFFVHKNLGGFLRREFDYFLKTEVLHLEDINFADPLHARRAAARLRVTRAIGEKIVTFLHQLESFQRQLFLKRKFILQSDYCLTLDKLPIERRADFYPQILANARQLAEWQVLYGLNVTPDTDLRRYPHLMLDTALFDADFKARLLACFDELDAACDGLLVHGENFQALNLLMERYKDHIKYIYIDPPYNTNATEIVYKNGYKHSTWLSMMHNRLELVPRLLNSSGLICVTIDDNELHRLWGLMEMTLDGYEMIPVVIEYNHRGRAQSNFAVTHEYALWGVPSDRDLIIRQEELASDIKRNLRRTGIASHRRDSPTQFYGIEISNETLEIISITAPLALGQPIPKHKNPATIMTWPIDDAGVERRWYYGRERVIEEAKTGTVYAKKINGRTQVHYWQAGKRKRRKTVWTGKRLDASTYGTELLNSLFGGHDFDFPKSVYAVQECIKSAVDGNDNVLDFFAGSGTTAHAVMNLNREDGGQRKYILVEMGDYFDTVLKPRIQKVAYAQSWKDGRPVVPENGQAALFGSGQAHMFQYVRLESYDDTFHNLRFRQLDGPQLNFLRTLPDYFLNYMLDHETQGSPTLLNIRAFERPLDYQLLVTGSDGVLAPQSVDLVATFNFLIGLAVQTLRSYQYAGGPYIRVTGVQPDGLRVCVLWRTIPQDVDYDAETAWIQAHVLQDAVYDKLYVNGETTLPGALLIEQEFKRRMFEDMV